MPSSRSSRSRRLSLRRSRLEQCYRGGRIDHLITIHMFFVLNIHSFEHHTSSDASPLGPKAGHHPSKRLCAILFSLSPLAPIRGHAAIHLATGLASGKSLTVIPGSPYATHQAHATFLQVLKPLRPWYLCDLQLSLRYTSTLVLPEFAYPDLPWHSNN